MSEMTIIIQRLDKMQKSIDGLRGELDAKLQTNSKSLQAQIQENTDMLRAEMQESASILRAEMCEMGEELRKEFRAEIRESVGGLRTELTRRMDNMEYGLGQEIQAVYELAQQNAENIRQLMPYKSRIINVCMMADRVERLEECQKVTTDVVASHSEAIRKLESRLA